MLEYWNYKKELRRLNKKYKEVNNALYEAKRNHKNPDNDALLSFLGYDLYELNCWIEYHKTNYLKHQANQHFIPMPDINDPDMYKSFDIDDDKSPIKVLTDKGIHNLRIRIREEHKAKREVLTFWFTVITGLVGAIIGLISVIKA